MAPRIRPGDVVVTRPVDAAELRIGQVLLVDDPDHAGRLRLHRFVATTNDDKLVLRGEANQHADSTPVARSAVRGAGFLLVPYVGLPVVWLGEGNMSAVALAAAGLLAALAATRLDRFAATDGAPRSAAAVAEGTATAVDVPGRSAVPTASSSAPVAEPATGSAMTPAPLRATRSARAWLMPRARTRSVTVGLLVVATALAGVVSVQATADAGLSGSTVNADNRLDAAGSFPCLSAPVANSPYLLYRFTEASGTAVADSSGNGRTGSMIGGASHAPGSCTPGDSPALAVTSTGYVATPEIVLVPAEFSMEIWFKTTSATGGRLMGIANARTGSSTRTDRVLYLTAAGGLGFGAYNASGATFEASVSSGGHNDGRWHHVVATMSPLAGRNLYVDGVLVASAPPRVILSQTGYWRVGWDAMSSSWPSAPTTAGLTGVVDGAAVYTAALTAAQVASHYSSGRH